MSLNALYLPNTRESYISRPASYNGNSITVENVKISRERLYCHCVRPFSLFSLLFVDQERRAFVVSFLVFI